MQAISASAGLATAPPSAFQSTRPVAPLVHSARRACASARVAEWRNRRHQSCPKAEEHAKVAEEHSSLRARRPSTTLEAFRQFQRSGTRSQLRAGEGSLRGESLAATVVGSVGMPGAGSVARGRRRHVAAFAFWGARQQEQQVQQQTSSSASDTDSYFESGSGSGSDTDGPRLAHLRALHTSSIRIQTIQTSDPDQSAAAAASAAAGELLSRYLQSAQGQRKLLNEAAVQKLEPLSDNLFRCHLHPLELFNISVQPIMDLHVAASHNTCTVEMLSFSLGTSQLGSKNRVFEGYLKNVMTWQPCKQAEGQLELSMSSEIRVTLEVYTIPFTMLPLSAVEKPGNKMLSALLSQLCPAFLTDITADFTRWCAQQEAL